MNTHYDERLKLSCSLAGKQWLYAKKKKRWRL